MTTSRLRTFVFLTSAFMVGAVAQAQQAHQVSSSTAATASSSQTASQPAQKAADGKATAAQSANKTPSAQKTAADPDAQLIREARNAGFKPTQMRGTLMFCRTARELGSNFPVRTCYDEDQVRIKIHEYQTERNQLEQMHGTGRFGN